MYNNNNVVYFLSHRYQLMLVAFAMLLIMVITEGCGSSQKEPSTKTTTDTSGTGGKPSMAIQATSTDTSGTGGKPSKAIEATSTDTSGTGGKPSKQLMRRTTKGKTDTSGGLR